MKRSKSDPSLYLKVQDDKLIGFILAHVDDLLYGGEPIFHQDVISKLFEHFDIKETKVSNFVFCGVNIETIENGDGSFCIKYNPTLDSTKLRNIDTSSSIIKDLHETDFRSLMGSIQWLGNISRPDLLYGVSSLLQKSSNLSLKDCCAANKLLRKNQSYKPHFIVCVPISTKSLVIETYSDASYANRDDLSSQFGYINFISDGKHSNVLGWKSGKLKRICRSTFASKLLACANAVDASLYFKFF